MNIFKFLKDKIIKPKPEPVTIIDEEVGTFTLDRFGDFVNEVDWLGEECSISLKFDEDSENSAMQALAVFKRIYNDRENWNLKFNKFAAQSLIALLNDVWLEDGEDEVTEEQFAARISIESMWVCDDGSYTVFFDDDGMFLQHSIVVCGNIDGEMESADLWG